MQKNGISLGPTSDHKHLTIFGDCDIIKFSAQISDVLDDINYKVLCPKDQDNLLQAAQNSSLVMIVQDGLDPKNSIIAQRLRNDRHVVCDIVAVYLEEKTCDMKELYLKDYDLALHIADIETADLRRIIKSRMQLGSQRLSQYIHEDEFRRFSDALSCAPASVMVFDAEKRIVFVSEHYFRAYPKSAPRLCRGLSVFDAFDMMSKEEKLDPESEIYKAVKSFWHQLNGQIEFSLDSGVSYRLTAVSLSNGGGTIVTAVNISDYIAAQEKIAHMQGLINDLKMKS